MIILFHHSRFDREMIAAGNQPLIRCSMAEFGLGDSTTPKLGFLKLPVSNCSGKGFGLHSDGARSSFSVKAGEGSKVSYVNGKADLVRESHDLINDSDGKSIRQMSTFGNSTNIVWHKCSVEKIDRQELVQQKGCVIWVTGLSGSGKSTLACALSRGLHTRGKLTYILDGDNVRHGLNRDLSFKAEDRAENIRRIGEVAKLFADAGVICIASLISPYRKDRDACRALLPEGDFIEVFMNVPLQVCEARDPKGLYKLARAGKIKGFTGIDDPYEPPLNSEIELQQKGTICASPCEMAETVISYLEEKGYLNA
ncbi:Adenylyl-sulfate kinase [Actinidia chinensis var. chinensis]|uniref:Adenylyl-sulfate kinase n=1 Tax=Actinidia chinensis var. chinensis TaxID=1590841 RepID=A0A2R6R5E8_ACTCC|nr:Adenylyl-sulfate kinase [Actinidia chinensis var. chinensis]